MAGFTPKRGCLVVFEGIDRSGKSTQARLAYERLLKEGQPTELIRFPDRTTSIGQVLDKFLASATWSNEGPCQIPPPQLTHLLFAANRWEAQARILRALGEGKTVLVDRYSFSGIAYTVGAAPVLAETEAKSLQADANASGDPAKAAWSWAASTAATGASVDPAFCRETERGLLAPDAVFFLDISPRETQSRGGYGEEVYEKLATQERVYQVYRQFESLPYWRRIPAASVSPNELHETVIENLKAVIQAAQPEQPLSPREGGTDGRRRLWDE
ncbi:Thymidylate kinase, related [Neospora caninum Liverpool]|uniref:dTMP kinase n=1 Tax=Neospora caninum (strain Liverpool) TaxID=572307 RepID=F0VME6_NEOCL|nr:Thymidylate kinase, related [Neospora caninum Liverpool]CBZ54892.1 Thymidylate kinase, related [Neospora caninum Liverpool]CEL69613.1 TPA: Thymidylate kinase, related [Neospora caninum Liverpool]|eukprot:XP_003884920.1 Thymidylate kinase, related [Neospora caninum Liverpool]